ncbi:uncharacterized protein LOC107493362 [Arachis duranensis]|uniref:Uncharacterized protein LOC107493362 n=1 Tax=Arachis duranensis TaxID=130453 RepID=A0A6P4DRP0_ARADU|nr:uncharacterized protein LOC107493362 [Arachis duranensis]
MDAPRRVTIKEAGAPDYVLQPLHVTHPNLNANFELKTALINLLPKFHGLPAQDPIRHLKDFHRICSTTRREGSDEVAIWLFAFPFSFEDKAKEWFYTLSSEVTSDWDLLRRGFLDKFLPPEKMDRLRKEMSCIVQGMREQDRTLLDTSSNGSLSKYKTAEEAWRLIIDLAESNQHMRRRVNRPRTVNEVSTSSETTALTQSLNEMTSILKQLQLNQQQPQPQSYQQQHPPPPQQHNQQLVPQRVCGICSCYSHYTDECPSLQEDNTLAATHNFYDRPNQGYYQGGQKELQNTLASSLTGLTSTLQALLARMDTSSNSTPQPPIQSIIPSQPQPNPKGSINAITLRSGTQLKEKEAKDLNPITTTQEDEGIDMEEVEEGETPQAIVEDEAQPTRETTKAKRTLEEEVAQPLPFQTLAKKAKRRIELGPKMVEMFKKVEVTIPLFDAIHQVPRYAKFLKDLCINKDRILELETIPLGSSISALMGALPEKCDDPGPCMVTCTVNGVQFRYCMCDLGACVSIMPLSVYRVLKLPPLKRSTARFVLADKSIITVAGVAEDVLVNIKGLVFPIDFYVLEMPSSETERASSILLGRPFLRTSRFKLDDYSGNYSFEIDGRIVSFSLEEAMKHPPENHSLFRCDPIDNIVAEVHLAKLDEKYMVEEANEKSSELNTTHHTNHPETQTSKNDKKMELKPLPPHLRYSYLDEAQELPVIIAQELTPQQEEKLLNVLRKNKRAIGWSLADLVGISPKVCEHRIFLEE